MPLSDTQNCICSNISLKDDNMRFFSIKQAFLNSSFCTFNNLRRCFKKGAYKKIIKI